MQYNSIIMDKTMNSNSGEPVESGTSAEMDLLDRFAQAVAHDLRNVVLPDSRSLHGDAPNNNNDRVRRQLGDLLEHLEDMAAAMDIWRDHERLRGTAHTIEQWWRLQARLFAALFSTRPRLRIARHVDENIEIDAGQSSKALATALRAIALQHQRHRSSIELDFAPQADHALEMRLSVDPPLEGVALPGALNGSDELKRLQVDLRMMEPDRLVLWLHARGAGAPGGT